MAKEDETLNTYYPLYDDGLYTEVVHENGEKAIKILKGNYKDIIYQYGKIELIPRAESEIPTINFDRAVRSCPKDLLANQGIQEYNYGIQQRVQTETNERNNK